MCAWPQHTQAMQFGRDIAKLGTKAAPDSSAPDQGPPQHPGTVDKSAEDGVHRDGEDDDMIYEPESGNATALVHSLSDFSVAHAAARTVFEGFGNSGNCTYLSIAG